MPRPRLKAAPQPGPALTHFVAYYRVSTDKQGSAGLGMDAQKAAVERFVTGQRGIIVGAFVEVESGRKNDRPQLAAALAECRVKRAALVVAKLDRLARNVAFISNLMEAGVDFRVAEMPSVTRLTLHILAAVAEEEARMISARTIAALAQAKARGVKLGNPRMVRGIGFALGAKGRKTQSERSRKRAAELLPYVHQAHAAGHVSLRRVADFLTEKGIKAPGGGEVWTPSQVSRVISICASNASDT